MTGVVDNCQQTVRCFAADKTTSRGAALYPVDKAYAGVEGEGAHYLLSLTALACPEAVLGDENQARVYVIFDYGRI